MTKQSRDRELRKSEVTGYAGKRVAKNVGGHVLELRLRTNSVENPYDTDEMSIAPVGREYERRTFPSRHSFDAGYGSLADDPYLIAALRVGETNTMIPTADPSTLQP
jgi:hypothetical protein